MSDSSEIKVIPLSKKKIVVLTLGAFSFTAVSFWIIFSANNGDRVAQFSGIIGILFFGLCAIYGIYRYRDNRPGLILHPDYIAENTGFLKGTVVYWKDITHLDIAYVKRTRLLVLHLKDTEEFLRKFKGMNLLMAQMNYRYYGSPLTISSATLSVDFDELTEWVSQYLLNSNGGESSGQ